MMQHSTTMSSAAAKRGAVSLQGPRPLPLSLPGTTSTPPRPAKRPRVVANNGGGDDVRAPPAAPAGPVILYEHTPKVIHARPDEFKALVQRLTGRPAGSGDQEAVLLLRPQARKAPPSSSQQEATTTAAAGDPLVLTLGQQQVPLPPPLPLDDHHHTPGGAAGGFLLSPGSFLFSPATMQAIHELIS